jgi:hypothetical protein
MPDTKIVVDCMTGEETLVDLTPEELAQREADEVAAAGRAAADALNPWSDFRSILPYLETEEDTRGALEVIATIMGG